MGARRLNQAEKAEIWRRWRQGESLTAIARALGRHHTAMGDEIARHGGIAPRARRRSKRHLSLLEREEISRGLCLGENQADLARRLARAPSTISRELARNGRGASYRAERADRCAWERARRPKRYRLSQYPRLQGFVAEKLQQQWSPEQISAALKKSFPDDETMRVSPETVYRSLFIQARGVLKQELLQQLRLQRRVRRARQSLPAGANRQGQIVDAISIRERPAEATDRAVPGHWEGDLLVGTPPLRSQR